ncbi:MAG TPA: undecaprenyl-diphosphate phosphatase [Candidatus Acidoferrum sp.]|jgi:undecaprenyl-diphosphatase|nr:undecaprenyl-diphosphate phosphatase [Candidatus Acidoferrum sp.]
MPLWFVIAVLGIIEGITEFLPVSSTGHLLIAEHWLGLHQSDLFNIVIQCGAVIAVLPLFPDRLHQFIFKWRERQTLDYLVKLSTAFVITGIGGFLMDKKDFKLKDNPVPIAVAMFIGGVAFIVVETVLRSRSPKNEVTWPIVVAVGLGQLLAAGFPGTSRSGATILLALVLGLNRIAATEFTFLVGIPTMLAAGGLKIFKAIHHSTGGPPENWGMVGLGFAVAAVVSFITVRWLLRYIQTHTFIVFGWYRIALAALIAALLLLAPVETKHSERSQVEAPRSAPAFPAPNTPRGG